MPRNLELSASGFLSTPHSRKPQATLSDEIPGGMAEWFKAAVLKTVVLFTGDRGFKSYSLRQEISRREIS